MTLAHSLLGVPRKAVHQPGAHPLDRSRFVPHKRFGVSNADAVEADLEGEGFLCLVLGSRFYEHSLQKSSREGCSRRNRCP